MYLLVVVQYSIHVLDPDGIHWAVKDEPLPVGGLKEERGHKRRRLSGLLRKTT